MIQKLTFSRNFRFQKKSQRSWHLLAPQNSPASQSELETHSIWMHFWFLQIAGPIQSVFRVHSTLSQALFSQTKVVAPNLVWQSGLTLHSTWKSGGLVITHEKLSSKMTWFLKLNLTCLHLFSLHWPLVIFLSSSGQWSWDEHSTSSHFRFLHRSLSPQWELVRHSCFTHWLEVHVQRPSEWNLRFFKNKDVGKILWSSNGYLKLMIRGLRVSRMPFKLKIMNISNLNL